jgi:hypothetical protein
MRSVDPTDWVKPGIMTGLRARLIDEAPVRGFHQGQRSCRPHQQAGHMCASDPNVDVQQVRRRSLLLRGHPHMSLSESFDPTSRVLGDRGIRSDNLHSDKMKFPFPFNTGTNREFVGMGLEIIELSADS